MGSEMHHLFSILQGTKWNISDCYTRGNGYFLGNPVSVTSQSNTNNKNIEKDKNYTRLYEIIYELRTISPIALVRVSR
jgi:hypothetical protein